MVIFKMKSTLYLLLVFPIILKKFGSLEKIYTISNKHYAWFAKFSNVLTSLNFHPNHHDLALFLKCTTTSHILLSQYVDNMIITGDNVDGIAMLKLDLASHL